jgi:hypothetical protein
MSPVRRAAVRAARSPRDRPPSRSGRPVTGRGRGADLGRCRRAGVAERARRADRRGRYGLAPALREMGAAGCRSGAGGGPSGLGGGVPAGPAGAGRRRGRRGFVAGTAALPGHNAIEDPDPARAVATIGEGLRAFHEALPVTRRHRRLPRGRVCSEHAGRRRRGLHRARRPRGPGRRGPVGGPRRRHVEHGVELRSGLGATPARRVRRRPRSRTDRLLPAAVGPRALTSARLAST